MLTEARSVLHMAPEGVLASLLQRPNIDYVSGDLEPGYAMEVMDITALPRPDHTFDAVLCNHVLEHTYEDWDVTGPEDRLREFGQEDHVRLYGRDFADRLTAAGFEVSMRQYADELDPSERSRYALRDGGGTGIRGADIYQCTPA
jgi:Methyltransferase domain